MCSTARASDEPVLADTRKGGVVWPLRSSAAATTQRRDRNGPPCWRKGNRWSRRTTAFASRQPTIPHTRPAGSAFASTTGACDPISYVGATERPTSSGLNTGLWGRTNGRRRRDGATNGTTPSGTARAPSTNDAACERAATPLLVLLPAGRSSHGQPLPSRTGTTLRRSPPDPSPSSGSDSRPDPKSPDPHLLRHRQIPVD
jgi:hypothetical protein